MTEADIAEAWGDAARAEQKQRDAVIQWLCWQRIWESLAWSAAFERYDQNMTALLTECMSTDDDVD